MFKRLLALTAMVLALTTSTVSAQITIPNSFVTRQVISSSKVNANFNQIGTQALNRTAPVLQATLGVDTTNAYDLGAVALQFKNGYFAGTVNANTFAGALFSGTSLTLTSNAVISGTTTLTGLLTANGGITSAGITINGGSFAAGAIVKAPIYGLEVVGITGSTNDFTIFDPAGNFPILGITTGTTITAGYTFQAKNVNTNNVPGMFSKHATNGLFITAITGATLDFALTNPSGASGILTVPTGTLNANFGGAITAPGTITSTVQTAFSGTGQGTGSQLAQFINTGASGRWGIEASSGSFLFTGAPAYATVIGSTNATALAFGTNLVTRWGINSVGDLTVGSANDISESVGTPTFSSGFGGAGQTLTGNDFAFILKLGTTNSTTGTLNFGHTWTNAPSCVAMSQLVGEAVTGSASTTQLTLNYTSGNTIFFDVICKGF